jgi:hypothetical protein
LSATEGIRRTGPPQAVQKLRESFYMVQIGLNEIPSADWKRLFYETQIAPPPDFLPRSIEISGQVLRFRSDGASVEAKVGWVDRWIARANEKEASMGPRLDEERRRRREEHGKEQQELTEWTERWAKI